MPSESAGRRAAVLGSPIGHSLSPVLHRAAYDALGLDWTYDAVECDEAGLPALLDGLGPEWVGLSLTMPLKRAVVALLDEVSALVSTTGVANTVLLDANRRRGENTDVHGLVLCIRETAAPGERVTVLGGGATAASAVAALGQLGRQQISVVVRSRARSAGLLSTAEQVGVRVQLHDWPGPDQVWDTDLLISTVPGTAGDELAPAVVPGRAPGALLDVVYAPWPTALAQAAAAAGATVTGGLALLVAQAEHQVELMTGRPAPVGIMRAAGERALRDG